jgi:hypothetical protein
VFTIYYSAESEFAGVAALVKGKCKLEDVNAVWELIWQKLQAAGRTNPMELAKSIGDRRQNLVAGNTANSIYGFGFFSSMNSGSTMD